MLTPQAKSDAYRLLRDAAPSPAEFVQFGPVQLACATFWARAAAGEANPEAQSEALVALGLRNILRHHLPDPSVLPALPPGVPEFDVDRITLVAGFASLVGGACSVLASDEVDEGSRPEALATIDQGIAWLLDALPAVPTDHELFPDIAVCVVALRMQRYELATDPHSLAGAAAVAVAACTHVPVDHPRQGTNLPLMLEVLVQAAILLGEPSPHEATQLARASGIAPLPQTVNRLEVLDGLQLLTDMPHEERELQIVGTLYAESIAVDDLPALACTAVRMRSLLAVLPEDHPHRASVLVALHGAYERLGWNASGLPEPPSDVASRLDAAVQRFALLQDGAREVMAAETGSLLDQVLSLGETLAVSRGLPDLPPEVRAAIAFADCAALPGDDPPARPLDRVLRYRRGFEALPIDHPARPAYAVIVTAHVRERAETLAERAPNELRELDAWTGSVIAELERSVPPGFEPLRWLTTLNPQAGNLRAIGALPESWSPQADETLDAVASASLRAVAEVVFGVARAFKEQMGGDFAAMDALMNVSARIGGAETLEADVRDLTEFMNRMGSDEEARTSGLAAIGNLLSALLAGRNMGTVSQDTLGQVADLLRQSYDAADQPSASVAGRLAETLTALGMRTTDPARFIEAEAVYADSDGASRTEEGSSAVGAYRGAAARVTHGLYSYVFAHDPEQLERARQSIPALLDLAERADAEQGPDSRAFHNHAAVLRDQLDVQGPGGGPKDDITDEVIERCRQTYASMPDGEYREQAAMNLNRALLSRAGAIRADEPERADRLLTEASEVAGSMPGTLGESLKPLMQRLLALQRGEPVTPVEIPEAVRLPSLPTGETLPMQSAMETVMRHAAAGRGTDAEELRYSVEIFHNPALPAWFRVQMGIIAALEAANLYPGGLDYSLLYSAETIALLEKLTDRGVSQQAAEHALTAFDGAIRRIASLALTNALLPGSLGLAEETGKRIAVLEGLVEEAVRSGGKADDELSGRIMEVVGSMTASFRSVHAVVSPQIDALVALHDRGRGLLLTRRLESRTDLSALRAAHPELAADFEELTGRLEAGDGAAAGRARLEGLRTSERLDKLIARIKSQPGFAQFLGWLSPDQLRAMASQGPIVVLNHAKELPCVAFIVTTDEISALHLKDVKSQEVADAARRLSRAIEAIYARGRLRPRVSGLLAARDEITEILDWAWHRIVEPVLDRIGYLEPVQPSAEWPRVWWIPTGPFNAIPLQAAMCKAADCAEGQHGSALDCVVSSFVPGFQTLAHARARAARGPGVRGGERDSAPHALIVSEPDDVLPGAVSAARFAADALGTDTVLVGSDANLATVLSALENSQWVQIGCHAHSSPDRPAGSWIQLPSGEALSVPDICRIRPDSARLAVLTACGTARSAERLSDEAVHVTSAFLLAGYPEAVGTLWEVESTQIESFLRGFYARALDGTATTAHAVHHAVRELRDTISDRPHVWAAYIHAGS